MSTTVILRNGVDEQEATVQAIMASLWQCLEDQPVAFLELVELCRDRSHRLFGNTRETLERMALVEHGDVHEVIQNVVLSAVEGDGPKMRLRWPCEQAEDEKLGHMMDSLKEEE